VLFTVRPATAGDAYRLADIVLAAGGLPAMTPGERAEWHEGFAEWSRRTVLEADPGNVLSVVMAGGEVVGRLRVVRDQAGVELAGIQLLPAFQGRGIGTSIIRDLQVSAAREGVPLRLGVEKGNLGARRLYERLGFRLTGETDAEYLLTWVPSPS
jgi:ribosomal protein S18 acetylase RimI-like enzyme